MLKRILIAMLALVTVLVAVFIVLGRRQLAGFWKYGRQARNGSLQVGDLAPDVELVALDGALRQPLSDWIGARPLVLVFGSFT